MTIERRDAADRVVALVSRCLPETRRSWASAMLAELEHVDGRSQRVRFALGCLRVALFPPRDGARAGTLQYTIVAGGVAALALALATQVRIGASQSTGAHGPMYTGAATALGVFAFAAYLMVALRFARGMTPRAKAARRYGVVAGAVVGVVMVLGNTPAASWLVGNEHVSVASTVVSLCTVVGVTLGAGRLAARAARDPRAGRAAGLWVGMTAGLILIVGLLMLTLTATRWFVHDPAVISQYRDSFNPAHFASYHTHYATITGFVTSENSDTALLGGLIWLPLLCAMTGALGAAFVRRRDV